MHHWKMIAKKNFDVLLVLMSLLYGCLTYNIDSKVCLNRTLIFAMGKKACRFTLEAARKSLESDISKDMHVCISTKDCRDVSKTCLLTGQVGVCVCKNGYIGFGNKCLEVNTIDSVIVGLVFLGLVLCIILTAIVAVVVVTIFHKAWNTKTEEKKCPQIPLFVNTTDRMKTEALPSNLNSHRTVETRESIQPLLAHSCIEIQENRSLEGTTENFIKKNDENDVVIYHWKEKEDHS